MAAVAAQRGLAQLQRLVCHLLQRPHCVCKQGHADVSSTSDWHQCQVDCYKVNVLDSPSSSLGPLDVECMENSFWDR